MSMGVAVALVMDRHIGTHPSGDELVFDISAEDPDLKVSVEFSGQSQVDHTGKPGIGSFLDLLYRVPKDLSVFVFFRCILRKKYVSEYNFCFLSVIVH